MNKRMYKIIPVLLAAALIFNINITAFAAKLKVGSVKGLPEKLVVLDDKGRSVSENGEYFFEVENMNAGEVYTKHIQIMNLREDASYRIYFNAQPLTNTGEIDLEKECKCNIYLNDKMIYYGKITGEGTPDMTDNPLVLGLYEPGDSRVLRVDIKWIPADHGGLIDNGAKVVDRNGVSIVREKSGKEHIEGETTFKWIFTAVVEDTKERTSEDEPSEVSDPEKPSIPDTSDDSNPDTTSKVSGSIESGPSGPPSGSPSGSPSNIPSTSPPQRNPGGTSIIDFVQTGDTVAIVAIIVVAVAMMLMIVLTIGKRKKNGENNNK